MCQRIPKILIFGYNQDINFRLLISRLRRGCSVLLFWIVYLFDCCNWAIWAGISELWMKWILLRAPWLLSNWTVHSIFHNCAWFSSFANEFTLRAFWLKVSFSSLAPIEFERRRQREWNCVDSSTYKRYQRSSQLAKMEKSHRSSFDRVLRRSFVMANYWHQHCNRSYPKDIQFKSQWNFHRSNHLVSFHTRYWRNLPPHRPTETLANQVL